MTLYDYRRQFRDNLMIMSRTANGRLDLSASGTKSDSMAVDSAADAQKLAFENTERALRLLFDNRRRTFRSAEELEELVLETAKITNEGITREGCLFRSGEDNTKYNYARIKDIPVMWDRYVRSFSWMLNSQCFEVEEIAAFCEYVINILGHFFADGCGKISMLISTYVFMRFDLPCPQYTSREEYYRFAVRRKIPSVNDLRQLPADPEFWDFVSYYRRLCPSSGPDLCCVMENAEGNSYICHLTAHQTGAGSGVFRQNIELFYETHGDVLVLFDCSALSWIDRESIRVLADLKASGRRFVLKNLNADCTVLFIVEGFEACLEGEGKLPKIDLSSCKKISEGANGAIYRVSDEMAAKTFKNEPDHYDLVRQRISMRNALVCGVPAPLSLGYAVCGGKIVILMELMRFHSLMKVFASEEDCDEYVIRYAQFIKQLHEIRDEKRLSAFMRDLPGQELLSKADRCDRVLPEAYRGRARAILEAADGPECLVHGDIQPNNILISEDEMLFIDFDSFSTGRAVYDLGSLYRTLLCNENRGVSNVNSFLSLSFGKCQRIWDLFTDEYFRGEQEAVRQKSIAQAELIGTVLALAKLIKSGDDPSLISRWAGELERLTDQAGADDNMK